MPHQQMRRKLRGRQRFGGQGAAHLLGQRHHLAHAEPGAPGLLRHGEADPARLTHLAQHGGLEARLGEAQLAGARRPGANAAQQALRRLAQHRDLPGLLLG
jgi:hypothetical protein